MIEITNEAKVLFPKIKATKLDIINYYKAVATHILPHLKNRPLAMEKYPNGVSKEGFFQKQKGEYFPKFVSHKPVKREKQSPIDMVIVNSEKTLLYLANQACITFHPFLSSFPNLQKPNRMIIDLDPPAGKFNLAKDAAKEIKKLLDQLSISGFVLLTGSKGIHIVIPVKGENFEQTRNFAKKIGQYLSIIDPKKYTTNVRKDKRMGRLFIDYLRNSFAQLSVAPYSLRKTADGSIAMPISWEELTSVTSSAKYTLSNYKQTLNKNPWSGMSRSAKSLVSAEKKLDNLIESF